MPKKTAAAPPDLRLYINPKPGKPPRFTADWQREVMPRGPNVIEYLETPKLKTFDSLLGSIRKGSVVVVRRTFLLAPWAGSPTIRKRAMAKRVDAIKAAGGIIMEAETGRRSDGGECAQMVADGSIDIASAGRANSKGKRGNPIELTPEQLTSARLIWRSRDHKNDKERLAAIEAAIGRKVQRTWCWQKFGSPSAPAPK